MKNVLLVLSIALIMLVFAACSNSAVENTISPLPASTTPVATETQTNVPSVTMTPYSYVKTVVFTDTVLESGIRKALGKPTGDVTLTEADSLKELDLAMDGNDWSVPRIKDISSLQYFTNLEVLNLAWALDKSDGPVDISPLAGLTKLMALYINSNGIEDISVLADMTDMRDLKVWGNSIEDISALSGMILMEDLWLQGNRIRDIGALSGMKDSLYRLYLDENQITDVSPLREFKNLVSLKLAGNPIEDYSSLSTIYTGLEEKDFNLN